MVNDDHKYRNDKDQPEDLPISPEPLLHPALSPPEPEPGDDDDEIVEEAFEENGFVEPRECGLCVYFASMIQNESIGLCLKRSQKTVEKEKLLWVTAKESEVAAVCKYWSSNATEYWNGFWVMIFNEIAIDALKDLIMELNKALAGKLKEETVIDIDSADVDVDVDLDADFDEDKDQKWMDDT